MASTLNLTSDSNTSSLSISTIGAIVGGAAAGAAVLVAVLVAALYARNKRRAQVTGVFFTRRDSISRPAARRETKAGSWASTL